MADTKPRQLSDRERQAEALRLRTRGKSWQSIADTLGYADRSSAFRSVKALITRVETESVEEWREVIGARYELLLEKALDDLEAEGAKGGLVGRSQMLTTARGIIDSQVRLLGVAANPRLELSGEVKYGNKELDAAIEKVLTLFNVQAVETGEDPQVGSTGTRPDAADPVSDPLPSRSHHPACAFVDDHPGPCGWVIEGDPDCDCREPGSNASFTGGAEGMLQCDHCGRRQIETRSRCESIDPSDDEYRCILDAGHGEDHTDGTETWA